MFASFSQFLAKSAPIVFVAGIQRAIFGFGQTRAGANVSLTNLVSNTGIVASDTTGIGTVRGFPAAASYGGGKAIFGYGYYSQSMTNQKMLDIKNTLKMRFFID